MSTILKKKKKEQKISTLIDAYLISHDLSTDEYYDGDLGEDMDGFSIVGDEDFLDKEDDW